MILITGGTGQLGKALKEFYPEAYYPTREELDLRDDDITELVRQLDPELIINCAAVVGQVDKTELEPQETILVNSLAVDRLQSGMRDMTRFIQISSDYATADQVYGLSKRLSERTVLNKGGLVIRTSWLFGQGKNWIEWVYENHGKSKLIVDDQIGRPTYTRDLARYIKLHDKEHGLRLVQNSGDPVSWYGYAQKVCDIAGLTGNFKPISTAAQGLKTQRPYNSMFSDTVDMPDWVDSLKEHINARG